VDGVPAIADWFEPCRPGRPIFGRGGNTPKQCSRRATRVGKGQYIEIQPEELEAIAIESKRTIEIDEFVPKKEIDELLNSPCYLAPDGDVGQQAFAVIRALP
jgi:non-homologous end joining protein Ku